MYFMVTDVVLINLGSSTTSLSFWDEMKHIVLGFADGIEFESMMCLVFHLKRA